MISALAPRPRVFVSSVIDGFEPFRVAARSAITACGGDPVLVNEDFPSLLASPRNACLDAIDSCDLVVTMVGERGGWTSPSGSLVTDEEFQHAMTKKIPVVATI
jgi:hypothetical protein